MTAEFTEIDLAKEIPSMSEDEAKETLSEFMETHQKNEQAYDELHTELDESEAEFEEQLEDYEETIAEFTQRRAEEASEYVNMPPELLADRFNFDELGKIIEEGEEADFSEDEETEEEETHLTTFAERGEKGKREPEDGTSRFRDEAEAALAQKGVPISSD